MDTIVIVDDQEERLKIKVEAKFQLTALVLVSMINARTKGDYSVDDINIYIPNENKFVLLSDDIFMNTFDISSVVGKKIRCVIPRGVNDEKHDLKLITGRVFNFGPNGIHVAGKRLLINEVLNNKVNGTGLNVWDGSILLARYLESNTNLILDKSILELGCGPGIGGISAGLIGAKEVIATDLDYSIQLARENIQLNSESIYNAGCSRIEAQICDWFSPPPIESFKFESTYPDTILIADCVWLEGLVDALLQTIHKYTREKTSIVFSYQRRGKAAHDRFFQGLQSLFGHIEHVDTKTLCGTNLPESLSIIVCRLLH
jgi:predicted nicotinamide N-methyase